MATHLYDALGIPSNASPEDSKLNAFLFSFALTVLTLNAYDDSKESLQEEGSQDPSRPPSSWRQR